MTDESVWVATRSGLNQAIHLESAGNSTILNWRTLSKAEGLADNYITAVVKVGADLWVGTPRGLGVRRGKRGHMDVFHDERWIGA